MTPTTPSPCVAAAIATHRREAELQRLLATLGNSNPPLTGGIFVADNASAPETRAVCQAGSGVAWLPRAVNNGPGPAWNPLQPKHWKIRALPTSLCSTMTWFFPRTPCADCSKRSLPRRRGSFRPASFRRERTASGPFPNPAKLPCAQSSAASTPQKNAAWLSAMSPTHSAGPPGPACFTPARHSRPWAFSARISGCSVRISSFPCGWPPHSAACSPPRFKCHTSASGQNSRQPHLSPAQVPRPPAESFLPRLPLPPPRASANLSRGQLQALCPHRRLGSRHLMGWLVRVLRRRALETTRRNRGRRPPAGTRAHRLDEK